MLAISPELLHIMFAHIMYSGLERGLTGMTPEFWKSISQQKFKLITYIWIPLRYLVQNTHRTHKLENTKGNQYKSQLEGQYILCHVFKIIIFHLLRPCPSPSSKTKGTKHDISKTMESNHEKHVENRRLGGLHIIIGTISLQQHWNLHYAIISEKQRPRHT